MNTLRPSALEGRELDAEVGKKVLRIAVSRGVSCMFECGASIDFGLTDTRRGGNFERGPWYDPVPEYSTDPAAADQVIQAVVAAGYEWEILVRGDGAIVRICRRESGADLCLEAEEESSNPAQISALICRAALSIADQMHGGEG